VSFLQGSVLREISRPFYVSMYVSIHVYMLACIRERQRKEDLEPRRGTQTNFKGSNFRISNKYIHM
jgi:hypothetical protein